MEVSRGEHCDPLESGSAGCKIAAYTTTQEGQICAVAIFLLVVWGNGKANEQKLNIAMKIYV